MSCSPSSRYSLGSIPLELIELTASYIHSRKDIVALALTCRKCKEATIPRYSEYRFISCNYRRSNVWEHLLTRPDLARNVRSLSILGDGPIPERYPSSLVKDSDNTSFSDDLTDGEKLKLVAQAVQKMSALVKCCWTTDLLFENVDEQDAEEDFWRALSHCNTLRHLDFAEPWNYRILYTLDTFTDPNHPIWSIGNLNSLSIVNAPFLWNEDAAPHFAAMLNKSPDLESLAIKLNHRECIMTPIFTDCRLSNLTSLSLNIYSDGAVHTEAFSTFLDEHPTIETLEWEYLAPNRLSAGSLPKLRNLRARDDSSANSAIVSIITDKSLNPARQMESLGLIPLNKQYMQVLEGIDGSMLTKLELRFFDSLAEIRKAGEVFPSLKCLQVPAVNYLQAFKNATNAKVTMDEWVTVLGFFRNLEAFHGVSFFTDPADDSAENDAMAKQLVQGTHKLRRVDHWDALSSMIVILLREPSTDSQTSIDEVGVLWKEVIPPPSEAY